MSAPEPEERLRLMKPEPPTERQLEGLKLLESGDYEIYSERLNNYQLEARELMTRAAISSMSRSGDLVIGIYNPEGDLATSSVGTYLHTCVGSIIVKYIFRNFVNNPTVGVNDGDVFYANEALYGGLHNMDQAAIMPVFNDGELVAWTAALAHQPETGAVDPGGFCQTAKSRCWEGMRLTPIKVGSNFRLHDDMIEMMENMITRTPRVQNTDMRARFTACDRLRRRVQELCKEKSNLWLQGLFRKMLNEAEAAARRKISTLNDGIYRWVGFGDTTGGETALLRVFAVAKKEGDHISFDLTGTSPEHDGGTMQSHCQGVVSLFGTYYFAHFMHDIPSSNGAFGPIDWFIPRGTWFNPDPMAAVAGAPPAIQPVFGFSYGIFAKMLFDSPSKWLVCAPNSENGGAVIAGVNQYGVPVADLVAYPFNATGQGARYDKDGVDAYGFNFAHFGKGVDAEEWESVHPIVHLFQNFLTDSCGHGKFRGGSGVASAQVIKGVPWYTEQGITTGNRIPSGQGLFGGYPAINKCWFMIRNTDILEKLKRGDKDIPGNLRDMVTKRAIKGDYEVKDYSHPVSMLKEGDIFVEISSGGPGYGDVLERDPAAVMEDIRKQTISHRSAQKVYHVAYDMESLTVDYKKTEELRQQEREARKARSKRYDEFEKEWLKKRPPEEAMIRYGAWPNAEKVREIIRI